MGKLFGYARVSTVDQDLTVQREALEKAGVRVTFEEKISGTKRDDRKELDKVLSILGGGDTLVVTRLGRSLKDLANIAHDSKRLMHRSKLHRHSRGSAGSLLFVDCG
jgi:DNA invertase Pin-like site-specific DNA recombinase